MVACAVNSTIRNIHATIELLLMNDGYFQIEFLHGHSEIENASNDQIKKLCIYNQLIEGNMDICKKTLSKIFWNRVSEE